MIFASCCLALVLLVFLACILKKSYFHSPGYNSTTGSNPPDLLGLFADNGTSPGSGIPFNIQVPFEKPPTYDESQTQMIKELGVPPPIYLESDPQPSTSSSPDHTITSSNSHRHHHRRNNRHSTQTESAQLTARREVILSPESITVSQFGAQSSSRTPTIDKSSTSSDSTVIQPQQESSRISEPLASTSSQQESITSGPNNGPVRNGVDNQAFVGD